jgi:hypothetical protein
MSRLLFLALALTLALPLGATAHPGHDHKLMGTISSVDGAKLVVKTTEGKEMTVQILPITKFVKGKAKGDQADMKAGLRVVVNIGDGVEPLNAKEIQYAAAATTK